MPRRAFTLVELTIVLLVLSILAALAMPRITQGITSSRHTAAATNMRLMADAAKRYKLDTGDWPADVNRGYWPPDFAQYLREFNLDETPVGGKWDWDYWPSAPRDGVAAAVSIVEINDDTMAAIDAILDDGDISTGIVRKNGDRLQYVLYNM